MKERERFFERWAADRLGIEPQELTLAILRTKLPRLAGLKYGDTGSPLGGRIDDHLQFLTEEELDELAKEGEVFLQELESEASSEDEQRSDTDERDSLPPLISAR